MAGGSGLASLGAARLGARLRGSWRLAGGDLSEVVRIALEDGREAVVKGGPGPRVEAAMLRALAAAGAPAPGVLAVDDRVLVMAWVGGGGALAHAWADLGTALSRLHASTGARYGWPDDHAFGAFPIANAYSDHWPSFWAQRRLLPHVPHLAPALARRIEALAADLPNRLPARPRASLLHGDLWGGNVIVRGARIAALIDPACYHGHAEVDIAMLQLFDSPDAAFHERYGALEPGSEARLAIYRLWPALVHLRLFGEGYRACVEQQLRLADASP